MNWSGNFREGLAREIRENKTLAKITAYTVCGLTCLWPQMWGIFLSSPWPTGSLAVCTWWNFTSSVQIVSTRCSLCTSVLNSELRENSASCLHWCILYSEGYVFWRSVEWVMEKNTFCMDDFLKYLISSLAYCFSFCEHTCIDSFKGTG